MSALSFSTAQTGVQNGYRQLQAGAKATLRGDLVDGAIEQKAGTRQVQASTKVIKAMDETLGTLLDELA